MKTTIQLISGAYYDFKIPTQLTVHEIAWALSNICRFAGHSKKFYSVAQHSVIVSQEVDSSYMLEALFHDAAEAVLGDVAKPLKQLLPDYQKLEHEIEITIKKNLHLPLVLSKQVKIADIKALATERRDLMVEQEEKWFYINKYQPFDSVIDPLLPKKAYELFISRYNELKE